LTSFVSGILALSFSLTASALQIDFSNARLTKTEFVSEVEFKRFESAVVAVVEKQCASTGVLRAVTRANYYDLYVQWSDISLLDEKGTVLIDLDLTFDDSSYGLSLRQIDGVKRYSCK